MDAMLDQVELNNEVSCEVSFCLEGMLDKVEGGSIATRMENRVWNIFQEYHPQRVCSWPRCSLNSRQ